MNRGKGSLATKLVTYKVAGYGLLIALAGLGLLWWSNTSWPDAEKVWQATINQLGGLLITTGGLGMLWDLRGKRDIMDEVLDKAKLASDVNAAGLSRVTMNWLDIPWDDLFAGATHIDVFISYGSSWRKVHWPKLQNFAKSPKHSLRIYLPDPDDETTMRVLAQRFDYTPEKVKGSVRETAEEFAKLGNENPADIRIYFREGDPTYTSYRFDDKVLVTLYSHRRQRGEVPTMLVRKGSFSDFFIQDLDFIQKQSRAVGIDQLLREGA